MKPVSEPTKKDDECPSCGFKYNGILRCHNMNGECELMNNTKIRPLIESLSNPTTLDTVAQTLPTWQKKLDNLRRLAYSTYFGTKNRLELITTLEEIQKESEQELSAQKAEVVGELKMGLLGIITSVSYSMKLSDGQVTVLNRQINDLLDTLNEGNT